MDSLTKHGTNTYNLLTFDYSYLLLVVERLETITLHSKCRKYPQNNHQIAPYPQRALHRKDRDETLQRHLPKLGGHGRSISLTKL